MLGLGLLAGAAYAVWRAVEARQQPTGLTWEPRPFPYPPEPRVEPSSWATDDDGATGWVDAAPDGACPVSHPVKAKLSSGIYHLPGGANYDRTRADRCYTSAAAAESDGLRPAKR